MRKVNIAVLLSIMCLFLISCGEVMEDGANQSQQGEFVGTVNYTWESDTYLNRIKIEGTVRNDTPVEQNRIAMRLRVKDGDYNILGEETVYLDPMPSGEETAFVAYIFDRTCPTSELRLYYYFEEY